jgi:hypothetical protein
LQLAHSTHIVGTSVEEGVRMRFLSVPVVVVVVVASVGWWGCTEPLAPVPGHRDRDSGVPGESMIPAPEKPMVPRDAGASRPTDGAINPPEVAALDAGSEAEAEPDDPAMTEDPPAMTADPQAMGGAMPTVVGVWFGPAEDLLERRYEACTTITQVTAPGPAGTVRATGALECDWDLEYKAFSDGEFAFDAIVKSGRGCFPSELRLPVPTSDTVRFNIYINEGSVPDGAGTLARVGACP